jgi:hypothetical protein
LLQLGREFLRAGNLRRLGSGRGVELFYMTDVGVLGLCLQRKKKNKHASVAAV